MWQFMICNAHQILLSYQNKKDKISKARDTRHERNINELQLVKPTGLRSLGQLCTEGRIRQMWIFNIQDGRAWAEFIWLRTGTSGGSCEHGTGSLRIWIANNLSASHKFSDPWTKFVGLLTLLRQRGDCFIQSPSPYHAVNTFHLGYKNQSVMV
jgi:hypothetical protein